MTHLVLVGLMGTGKSTVGRRVAATLGRPFLDSDELIEQATGRTVRQIWRTDGESAFRVLETDALRGALASEPPAVIAAAGGVVLSAANRDALNDADATVVWLSADPEVLINRATRGVHRPLLDDDPEAALRAMAVERADLYRAVADVTIDVRLDRSEVDDVGGPLRRCVRRDGAPVSVRHTVTVPLGDRSYDVVVGHGSVDTLASLVPAGARRVAVVTQAGIPLGAAQALTPLGEGGRTVTRIEIGDGEAAKSLTTVEHITRALATAGVTRHDVVVAVGGGMVTDVAGFAAAVWHRGVPVIHVATTLLGMVDAAIGGKTAVNLPEGKNLVGAFWQPIAVVCDLDALDTLPARERRSGDGEMAKYHFLSGDDLAALPLADRVARCVALKAAVVADDEREGGRRALLNYGHTLGHAVEVASGHAVTHGEAVGVGLVYAAELAQALGRIDVDRVAEHRRVVGEVYDLDTSLPAGLDPDDLMALMGRDKKALDGLTFVLDGPAGVEVVSGVDPTVARATLTTLT